MPVPGQTMDVDLELSDGEGIVPPRKKEPRNQQASSPGKRGAQDHDGVSVDVLKSLFKEQNQELKSSLREELAAAIDQSETKMRTLVKAMQTDLEGKIEEGGKELAKVREQQGTLLARVTALESHGSNASAAGVAPPRPATLLFGGWKAETKRSIIVADITKALAKAGAADLVDQPPWVPRARHSICLSEMRLRKDETESDKDKRMYDIIAKVNDPAISTLNLAAGGTLWAALSRPKTERGAGSHASKVRRLLHTVKADFAEVDAVYDSGSIWHQDLLVASVDKPKNGQHVLKGKVAGSWVDLVALAKTTGRPQSELEEIWAQIMS